MHLRPRYERSDEYLSDIMMRISLNALVEETVVQIGWLHPSSIID